MGTGVAAIGRGIAVALAACAALAVSVIAHADEPLDEPAEGRPDQYTDPGFYLGAGLPLGTANFSADLAELFPTSLLPPGVGLLSDRYGTRPAFGVRAFAGYKIFRYLAVEGEYEWMATRFAMRIQGAPLLESRPWTMVGNLKGYILKGRVQPFVKVGGGWMNNDLFLNVPVAGGGGSTDFVVVPVGRTVSGPVLRVGGGIELYGNEHAAVSVDFSYVMPFGDADGFDYWSIGLFNAQYRF